MEQELARGGGGRARSGGGGHLLDGLRESDLDGLGGGAREQPRRARQAEVANQEGGWRGRPAAEALETDTDLDQRSRQRKPGLGRGFVGADGFQVRAVHLREAVLPEALQAVELAVDELHRHQTGSTSEPASCRNAESAL